MALCSANQRPTCSYWAERASSLISSQARCCSRVPQNKRTYFMFHCPPFVNQRTGITTSLQSSSESSSLILRQTEGVINRHPDGWLRRLSFFCQRTLCYRMTLPSLVLCGWQVRVQ